MVGIFDIKKYFREYYKFIFKPEFGRKAEKRIEKRNTRFKYQKVLNKRAEWPRTLKKANYIFKQT